MLSLPDDVGPGTKFNLGKLHLDTPPHSRELVLPPQLCFLFILWPHSTVWLIHNRAVLLGETKSCQHKHVCQNYRIFINTINTLHHPRDISLLQTLGVSDCIIQDKGTWPSIASFSASVYCSFAQNFQVNCLTPEKVNYERPQRKFIGPPDGRDSCLFHKFVCKGHMVFEMSTIVFHNDI